MQDLLLAQKRDRPAYCFQHLDLEIVSCDHGAQANLAAVGATLAFRHDVVACFKPEWNSLDVNKIRSFNILGGISAPRTRRIAAFGPKAAKATTTTARSKQ
jgi:hypothetical protein